MFTCKSSKISLFALLPNANIPCNVLVNLEEQKRREYEEWFQTQQREAMEYSSVVQYRESTDLQYNQMTQLSSNTSSTVERVDTHNISSSSKQDNEFINNISLPQANKNTKMSVVQHNYDEVDKVSSDLKNLSENCYNIKQDGRISVFYPIYI